MRTSSFTRSRRGFSLLGVALSIVGLGVVAAFAIPRIQTSSERSNAVEAFAFLDAVRSSQDRYHARQGAFAARITELDAELVLPKGFSVGGVAVPSFETELKDGWELTLTRSGAPNGFGPYTIVFTHEGFDGVSSSIDASISPLHVDD